MDFSSATTDDALLAEIGARIARTRLERNIPQDALAEAASVGVNTLRRMEAGRGSSLTNFLRVLRSLDLLEGLDRALPEPRMSPIQQLALHGRQRKRGTGRSGRGAQPMPNTSPSGRATGWSWPDEDRQ